MAESSLSLICQRHSGDERVQSRFRFTNVIGLEESLTFKFRWYRGLIIRPCENKGFFVFQNGQKLIKKEFDGG
ncbi:hypothetical protein AKL21_07760 [Enterococcus canintestini]|uniref:Uncharacterized protein n=1 Tax=Enterococcus canintestini TaxID=317010 RepID=A0A267HS15_9ENTE|nr:hypothetical protein [Enterococcus canintestini]PAB01134.1 hypothetical protein AKL21_07760 [Enterococcus canintestini]